MKTPEQVILNLRQPLEPAHGAWEMYRRALDGLAMLLEQNEEILTQLKNLNEPVSK